jgi:hypothetical protein
MQCLCTDIPGVWFITAWRRNLSIVIGCKGLWINQTKRKTRVLFFFLVKNVPCDFILFEGKLCFVIKQNGTHPAEIYSFSHRILPLSVPRSSFPSLAIFCFFLEQHSILHSFSYILIQDMTLSGALLDPISTFGVVSDVLIFAQHVHAISVVFHLSTILLFLCFQHIFFLSFFHDEEAVYLRVSISNPRTHWVSNGRRCMRQNVAIFYWHCNRALQLSASSEIHTCAFKWYRWRNGTSFCLQPNGVKRFCT